MTLMRLISFCLAAAIPMIQPATAQDHGNVVTPSPSPGAPAAIASPYAGMEKRLVKALSDQQIAELRAGRGMGLALAAELNGYPGPLHVLELADALQLSDEQRTQTKVLLEAMKAETVQIGERIITKESVLDHLFAARLVTQISLNAITSEIGAARGELRSAHLRYHLAITEILSPAQLTRYADLRGYAKPVFPIWLD